MEPKAATAQLRAGLAAHRHRGCHGIRHGGRRGQRGRAHGGVRAGRQSYRPQPTDLDVCGGQERPTGVLGREMRLLLVEQRTLNTTHG